MKQIRDNIYQISWTELGNPAKRGDFVLKGLGTVMVDVADLNYATKMKGLGFEPTLFVSQSKAMSGRFVVVARQQKA